MKYLKTYESFGSIDKVEEALGDTFRSWEKIVSRVYAGLQSNDEKTKKELKSKYEEYIATIPVGVASKYISNVIAFCTGKGDAKNVTEEEVAKVFMGAKQVSKDSKGNWKETGARGSVDTGKNLAE